MALSRHQIDTLIKLVDIEIKILDDYPDDGVGTRRVPQLAAVRTELVNLTTAGGKKAFADMSWKKIRPWNRIKAPRTLEVPKPPLEARVTGSTGGTGAFWLKHD